MERISEMGTRTHLPNLKFLLTAFIFLESFNLPAVSLRAQEIELLSHPFHLVSESETVRITWKTPVVATMEYGRSKGNYPHKLGISGLQKIDFVPSDVPMGSGIFYCRVTNGTLHSAEFVLIVESSQAPVMRFPQNGAVVSSASTRFSWDAVPGVPFYHLILSDQPVRLTEDENGFLQVQGANIIYQAITSRTEINYGQADPSGYFQQSSGIVPPLLPGKTYNWIVLNNYGNKPAYSSIVQSGVQGFSVQYTTAVSAPTLVYPASGAVLSDETIRFQWHGASGAVSYQFELFETLTEESSVSTFPVWQIVTTATSVSVPARRLCKSGRYYWHVIALDASGKGKTSEKWFFDYVVPIGNLFVITKTSAGDRLPRTRLKIEPVTGSSELVEYLTSDYGNIYIPVQPGIYKLTAIRSGFRDSTTTATVEVNDTTSVTFFLKPAERQIAGTVVDPGLQPLQNATVILNDLLSELRITDLTDQAGKFEILVEPSFYRLSVQKEGYVYTDSLIIDVRELNHVTLSDPIRMQVANAQVSGRVVSENGTPLLGATVVAKNGQVHLTRRTDTNGSFQFLLSAGKWRLSAQKSGYAASLTREISVSAGQILNLSPDFSLTSQAAVVSGLVTDGVRPIAGVHVLAAPSSGAPIEGFTNGKGSFSLSLAPGVYDLRFSHPEYLTPADLHFELSAGENRTGLIMQLEKAPAIVSGRVWYGTTPLAGVVVASGTQRDTSRIDGYYELPLRSGIHRITAQKQGFYQPQILEITVAAGQVLNQDLIMQPNAAEVSGFVREGNVGIAAATVKAVAGTDSVDTNTRHDGSFQLFLAPGVWTISAIKEGFLAAVPTKIAVNGGQRITGLNLQLIDNTCVVQGTVRSANGTAIPDAAVAIINRNRQTQTDFQGAFKLTCSPGTFWVKVVHAGFLPDSMQISLAAGESHHQDFVLSPLAQLSGSVTDLNGVPVNLAEAVAVSATAETTKTTTDYTGEFKFYLPSGTYTVRIDKLGYSAVTSTVSLQAGTVTKKLFQLPENPNEIASISGHIFLDDGSPLGGVVMTLSGKQSLQLQSDPFGYYSVNKLEAGYAYVLTPRSPGMFFLPPFKRFNPLTGTVDNVNFTASYFGDLSGNQEISAFDGSLVLRISARQNVSPYFSNFPRDSLAADVSGNGKVSSFDASLIFRYAVGLIHTFPVEEKSGLGKTPPSKQKISVRLLAQKESGAAMKLVALAEEPADGYSVDAILTIPERLFQIDRVELAQSARSFQAYWTFANDELVLAAAGTQPLQSDTLFTIYLNERGAQPMLRNPELQISALWLDEQEFDCENAGVQLLPKEFSLSHGFPNPFNQEIRFVLGIPESYDGRKPLRLHIYNVLGQRVKSVQIKNNEPGFVQVRWDGTSDSNVVLASGVYILRCQLDNRLIIRKMVLVR